MGCNWQFVQKASTHRRRYFLLPRHQRQWGELGGELSRLDNLLREEGVKVVKRRWLQASSHLLQNVL